MNEQQQLFKISQLAEICGLATSALRHYDDIGLLRPSYVDPETKYRYYTSFDLGLIILITNLKETGMQLSDIAAYLQGDLSIEEQIAQLEQKKIALQHSIEVLKSYGIKYGELNVEQIILPERFCVCRQVVVQDVSTAASEFYAFLSECVKRELRLSKEYPSFCQYPDIDVLSGHADVTDFAMNMCYCLDKDYLPDDTICFPAQKTISVTYRGPYEEIHVAYKALAKYLIEHKLTTKGAPEEVYLEETVADHAPVTRIFVPSGC